MSIVHHPGSGWVSLFVPSSKAPSDVVYWTTWSFDPSYAIVTNLALENIPMLSLER
jgi:hypothetical protein